MLLLTSCEVHTGKYLDRSFEVLHYCIAVMKLSANFGKTDAISLKAKFRENQTKTMTNKNLKKLESL